MKKILLSAALSLIVSLAPAAVRSAAPPATKPPAATPSPLPTPPPQSCPPGFKLTPTAANGSSRTRPLYAFMCTSMKITCPPGYELSPNSAIIDSRYEDFRFICTQPYRR